MKTKIDLLRKTVPETEDGKIDKFTQKSMERFELSFGSRASIIALRNVLVKDGNHVPADLLDQAQRWFVEAKEVEGNA